MAKLTSFEGIGYVAATFPVDAATQTYLKTNYTEATTGNVDINGKQLAVKLNADGTVGFGNAEPTEDDTLIGIIMTYEMDGYAGVQIYGGVDNVPTKEAVEAGYTTLVVNDKGQVQELATVGHEVAVVKPATADSLFVSIKL